MVESGGGSGAEPLKVHGNLPVSIGKERDYKTPGCSFDNQGCC
jgi:hypothetical protein